MTNRSKSCSQIADGRNDIWPRPPGSPQARGTPVTPAIWGKSRAGMLILAGGGRGLPMDYDELERWTRVEFERGMRLRKGNGRRRNLRPTLVTTDAVPPRAFAFFS